MVPVEPHVGEGGREENLAREGLGASRPRWSLAARGSSGADLEGLQLAGRSRGVHLHPSPSACSRSRLRAGVPNDESTPALVAQVGVDFDTINALVSHPDRVVKALCTVGLVRISSLPLPLVAMNRRGPWRLAAAVPVAGAALLGDARDAAATAIRLPCVPRGLPRAGS